MHLTEFMVQKKLGELKTTKKVNLEPCSKNIRASVLVPLIHYQEEWFLLYTLRTNGLQTHKGQVAFPGGVFEPQDKDIVQTALRETKEEISLGPDNINILGEMDRIDTVTGYSITPVVGKINWPVELSPAPDEVEKIFTIPVGWLLNSKNWEIKPYHQKEKTIEPLIFYKPYEGEILWGITAEITHRFLYSIGLL